MPDEITHVLVAWTLATLLGFRFKQFSQANSAIVILGALVPDIQKIYIFLDLIGVQILLIPIHLPVVSLLLAGLRTLLFEKKKLIFSLLALGIFTHYALDFLMFSGGMSILYPFSALKWQIGIISVTDYRITVISIIAAFLLFLLKKNFNNTE
ncbi:MAG: metal-dependent hydrolase [Methanobacterium sp.]